LEIVTGLISEMNIRENVHCLNYVNRYTWTSHNIN